MRYIRKLFWFIMASAALTMFTGYSRIQERAAPVVKQIEELKRLRKKTDQQILKQSEFSDPSLETKKEPTYTYREKTEVFDGKKLVFIKGKYYEHREDNIYMIDGVRTYFKSNEKIEEQINHADPNMATGQQASAATEAGEEVALNIPKNTQEAMQRLKDYKGIMEARDKLLDSLRNDGQ